MQIKRLLPIIIFSLASFASLADEGMWLPSLIKQGAIKEMQHRGLRLSADDLYSVNKASLNDAIVLFDGGCTGEMISPEGLLLTNHHCGYDQIQAHSSLENDYLTNGFAAMNRREELPNPGLKVSFLREMRDVTELIKAGREPNSIITDALRGTHFKASIEPLYNGGEYYLFIYEVFSDVRLVFAPPSAIGKFGGDTDNWMWPRHTGDFAIFRVYADKDNRPTKYSPDNQPYIPKQFFKISTRGVQEGDFTFVYGFPARTKQFLHSSAVRYIVERGNPEKVALRDIRLEVMNRYAALSPEIRIKYAAKNASVANAWKRWQGEMQGLKRLRTVERKMREEQDFEKWALGTQHEGLTTKLAQLYDSIEPYQYAMDIYKEAVWGSEMLLFMRNNAYNGSAEQKAEFEKNYDQNIDDEITSKLFRQVVEKLDPRWLPVGFTTNSRPSEALAIAFRDIEHKEIVTPFQNLNRRLDSLYTIYIKALREMQPNRNFYPDANSTLRIAYGQVAGYEPQDGVYYKPISTVRGIMEKDRPEIYDYNVPQKLRELAPDNLDMPVAFIATNHTSGGNSGSPVLDSHGRLIGVNFDRVWQGTMSDIEFDAQVCRNISLDIRFVLFIIDKYAGAGYLLDEMTIVQ